MVFYIFTELIGYSMNLKINYDTRKLARTSRIIKKKTKTKKKKKRVHINNHRESILKKLYKINSKSKIQENKKRNLVEKRRGSTTTKTKRLSNFFFNMGIRVNLRAPRLIPPTIKLTTI